MGRIAESAYGALRRLLLRMGYHLEIRRLGASDFPSYVDPFFVEQLERVRDLTMVPWRGLYMSYQAARYIAQNKIEGDIVECGVWRGGCTMLMAETAMRFGDSERKVYLYDTFEGMAEPEEIDRADGVSALHIYNQRKSDGPIDWCYSSYDEVSRNLDTCDYPRDRFILIKGKVEDTIPATIPERISLLRLDTDWYQSTRHELIHLFPRLVPGGLMVCDDYGAWEGARKAVDEYLAELGNGALLYVDTGSGRAVAVKPQS